ncbi:hypothetical protein JOC34_003942 [Virgibacillus halotolerans]|nr:hypothetical protein [Virgibacillus halotolerans]
MKNLFNYQFSLVELYFEKKSLSDGSKAYGNGIIITEVIFID